MDKIRQLTKTEIQDLNIARLAKKCQNLYFVCLDEISDYYLKPLEYCRLAEIHDMIEEKKPIIEIYGVRDDEDE